jgi:hypothetical protein|tara:strand:+ start:21 stop:332 length:312 start_codon:yes stop_codon:yes gene_type:complete
MTSKNIIEQIEALFGRQSEAYMIRLMNDGLANMSSKKQEYTASAVTDLEQYKRWYTLDDQVIDITKIEILDTNSRYVMIPKLSDPHRLLREDTDLTEDSLTSS